ncbi:GNAT family N-acetyltransferase [Desmospora activa]|uniref:Acetyltransferase (GNAT) family protein n=1 Tax=Desmospora activa DSM 45169 TaxID=1121389 RepID=A0A2T4Z8J0_9BACL|nr:GNAT family N-acetyltransferase [Desmospora activa]PTM58209.1 acetyltransferase (GNAT) family protein [Desmospora activa DSM 45169]
MPVWKCVSFAENPSLYDRLDEIADGTTFPLFLIEGDQTNALYWTEEKLFTVFASYQFVLFHDEQIVASGNAVPIFWDGTKEGLPDGFDGALRRAFKADKIPNTLCAVSVIVAPSFRGKGISSIVLEHMRENAIKHGHDKLIVPVRPTKKHLYPLISMEDYIKWTQPDGSPFDPWIRTHWRLGAKILQVAPASMVAQGPLKQWEDWTDLKFPQSGNYTLPGALQPIQVEIEKDVVTYEDPNVWMQHHLRGNQ